MGRSFLATPHSSLWLVLIEVFQKMYICLFVCLIWSLATLIVLQTHMGTWAEISSQPKVTDYTRLGNREKNDQLQYNVCA